MIFNFQKLGKKKQPNIHSQMKKRKFTSKTIKEKKMLIVYKNILLFVNYENFHRPHV